MKKDTSSPDSSSTAGNEIVNEQATERVDPDILEVFQHPIIVINNAGEIVQINEAVNDLDQDGRNYFIGNYDTTVFKSYGNEYGFLREDAEQIDSGTWTEVTEGHLKHSNGDIRPVQITPRELTDTSLTALAIDSILEKEAAKPETDQEAIGAFGKEGVLYQNNRQFTDYFSLPEHSDSSDPITIDAISDNVESLSGSEFKTAVMNAFNETECTTCTVHNPATDQYLKCDIYPSTAGFTIRAEDVTGRESEVQQLRRNTQHYQAVFNNPHVYGMVVALGSEEITDANEQIADRFDSSKETLVGSKVSDTPVWTSRESTSMTYEEILESIRNGEEARFGIEYGFNESKAWVHVCCTPVRNERDEIIGFTFVGVDITAYKKAESTLETTERKYEALFNNPYAFTTLVDTDMTIIDMNENAEFAAGMPAEEVIGTPLGDSPFAGKQETDLDIEGVMSRAIDGEPVEETYSISINGNRRWFNVLCMPIKNEEGDVVSAFAFGQDITEKVTLESELQEKESQYKAFMNDETTFSCLYNLDGTIADMSSNVAELWGNTKEDMIGKHISETYVPDIIVSDVELSELIQRAKEGEVSDELICIEIDGERQWHSITCRPIYNNGEVVNAFVNGVNVTEKVEMESKLESTEQKYEALFEDTTTYSCLFHLDGTIAKMGPMVADLGDKNREEYEGMHINDTSIVEQEHTDVDFAELIQQARDGVETDEIVCLSHDGDRVWHSIHCSPVYQDGEVTHAYINGHDVTEKVQIESELESTEMRYKALLEDPNTFSTLYNLDGTIEEISSNVVAFSEKTREELIGEHITNTRMSEAQFTDVDIMEMINGAANGETTEGILGVEVQGTPMWHSISCTPVYQGGEPVSAIINGQDITDYIQAQRKHLQKKREAETYERLTTLSERITDAINDASSEDEVYKTVFDRIEQSMLFDSVWIGKYNPRSNSLMPLHSTTTDKDAVNYEAIQMDSILGSPMYDAIMNESFQVEQGTPAAMPDALKHICGVSNYDSEGNCGPPASWRDDIDETECNPECDIITTPIQGDEMTYGVIACCECDGVVASQSEGVFEVIGGTVGKRLTEIHRGEFSASNEVTQLDIFTERADSKFKSFFPSDGEIEITVMHKENSGYRQYGLAKNVSEEVVEEAMDHFGFTESNVSTSPRDEDSESLRVKMKSECSPLADIASVAGVEFSSFSIRETGLHIQFNIPKGKAPRETLAAVQEVFPNASIESRVQIRRDEQSVGSLGSDLISELTDRQQTILEVAASEGYWDLSDSANQQELAEELGISASTLREHLKKGSKKVFDELFGVSS